MSRFLLSAIAFATTMLVAEPAFAQAPACERSDIEKVAANYVQAQTEGFPLLLKPADFSQYIEQGAASSMSLGIISTPLKVTHHRAVVDVATCTAFTELVGTGPKGAVLIGARAQYAGTFNPIAPERVNEIELIFADTSAGFDPAATAKLAAAENWGSIPESARATRAALVSAADAYLTHLGNAGAAAPLAANCTFLSEGRYADGGCAKAPSVTANDRRYVVDETIGAVAALFTTGPDKRPAVHLLRIEGGQIRAVHALAVR